LKDEGGYPFAYAQAPHAVVLLSALVLLLSRRSAEYSFAVVSFQMKR
jgi:hypothetical protein